MIILKNIIFELFELMITKRTTMMSINNFFDAALTIDMSASSNVAIVDLIETYSALKLIL
jgi:maltodextrin utilization protein YvdJ